MPLSSRDRQELKARAHGLKPVVMISHNGLSETVKNELETALNHHELIKIRIQLADRDLKRQLFNEIGEKLQAELVLLIGNIGVLYRKNPEK